MTNYPTECLSAQWPAHGTQQMLMRYQRTSETHNLSNGCLPHPCAVLDVAGDVRCLMREA